MNNPSIRKLIQVFSLPGNTLSPNSNITPNHLASLIIAFRKFNAEHQLTGLLSYADGYYLHFLEGDSLSIDREIKRLKDKEQARFTTLLDTTSTSRSFPSQHMKLVTSFEAIPELSSLLTINLPGELSAANIIKYTKTHTQPSNKDGNINFEKSSFMLERWPNLGKEHPSMNFLELCAKLVQTPTAYSELVANNPFPSNHELNKTLLLLKQLSILKITEATTTRQKTTKTNNFFNSLRSLIQKKSNQKQHG